MTNLVLDGKGGTDTFDVTATPAPPLPYSTIALEGLVHPSVANLTGDGTLITTTMGTPATTVTGGGLGTVTLTGVGMINRRQRGRPHRRPGDRRHPERPRRHADRGFDREPSRITAWGRVVNTTNTGTLTLGGVAGNIDTVTVVSTAANDFITATSGATPTVSLQYGALPLPTIFKTISLNIAGLAALDVDANGGNDNLDVDSTAGAFPIPVNFVGSGGPQIP